MNRNALIESGAYDSFKKIKNNLFYNKSDTNDLTLYPFAEEDTKEMFKMYEAHKKRNQRMYEKLLNWLHAQNKIPSYKNYKIIFATLTFTDEQLDHTTPQTRRKYVFRYLSKVSEHYIANIDFGSENGREHYHAVLFVKNKLDPKEWKQGFSFYEEVKIKNQDYIKLTKYLNKITNHSFKESNKLEKVIYDRNKDLMISWQKLISQDDLRKFKIALKRNYE